MANLQVVGLWDAAQLQLTVQHGVVQPDHPTRAAAPLRGHSLKQTPGLPVFGPHLRLEGACELLSRHPPVAQVLGIRQWPVLRPSRRNQFPERPTVISSRYLFISALAAAGSSSASWMQACSVTIDFSKALLAARIPSEKLQLEAIEYMTKTDWSDNTPSYRECANHVQQNYMLRLDKARFTITDASLLPKAGSCSDCSKRTGANPDLFSDVDSADVCTDRTCFDNKTQAHIAQQVAAAKEKGQTVIVGEEAQELAGQHGYNDKMVGYRRLDTAEDSPTDQPLRKIIGKQMEAEGILPVKIESRRNKGELLDALPNDVVLRLLKAVEGQADASAKVSKEVIAFAEDKKAKAAAKAEGKYEQAWRNQLRDRTWEVIIEDSPPTGTGLSPNRPGSRPGMPSPVPGHFERPPAP